MKLKVEPIGQYDFGAHQRITFSNNKLDPVPPKQLH